MSYMSKYDKRLIAHEMRRKGISISVIAKEPGVSKSTASKWCLDIPLTEEQKKNLLQNSSIGAKRGQQLGAETNKKKRSDAIKEADAWGMDTVSKISSREALLIATDLYWSEGAKSDSTSRFVFANSDPEMILLMKNILIRVMGIQKNDIVCTIQINRIHEPRIETVLNFWKKLLKLEDSQLRKPYYVNTKLSKIYENHDNYYGVCRLIVRKSKPLKYKILGLIKGVRRGIMSA